MRITAVLNQKGGVGKTALAVGVAGALADTGARVLLVDLDPQGHATTQALHLEEAEGEARLAAALTGDWTGPVHELATTHSHADGGGTLEVWANSIDMFVVARQLDLLRARETRLSRLLEQVAGEYEHVLIDCPPALDVLTDNALAAADGLLIPVQLERSSQRALHLLLQQIHSLEQALQRPQLQLHGLVPALYRRPLTVLARTVLAELEQLPLPTLAHLPLAVTVAESWEAGTPLTRYAPDTEAAATCRELATTLTKESTP